VTDHNTDPDTDRENEQAIRRATADDVTDIAELIAVAFFALDVSAWLIPNDAARIRPLIADFRIWVEHALEHGEIHLIDQVFDDNNRFPIAAAVWFPLLTGPMPLPENYETRLFDACGPATSRFQVLDEHFDDTHPDEFPHHYLAYLATRPGRRNGGLGTALLQHHHGHLDHKRFPAFLHASCDRSRRLYERHGYLPRGDPFYLPDGGPPMWPMWREHQQPQRV
jgi:GNAT superfamily N-acetyltransferase